MISIFDSFQEEILGSLTTNMSFTWNQLALSRVAWSPYFNWLSYTNESELSATYFSEDKSRIEYQLCIFLIKEHLENTAYSGNLDFKGIR